MERTTFLKNYRIRLQYDGSPYEPATAGSITSYEAVDQRTAEPVSVTLIPAASIDSSERQQFEEDVLCSAEAAARQYRQSPRFWTRRRRLRLCVRAACGRNTCVMGAQPRFDAS